jgi:hypothetical protein
VALGAALFLRERRNTKMPTPGGAGISRDDS